MGAALLRLHNASRRYLAGDQVIYALRDIDLDISEGEMVALVGSSGSGKSTLLSVLGCLDRLSDGRYSVGGVDTAHLDSDQLAELRRKRFGYVFQRYNLLSQLSAQANVELPAVYAGLSTSERQTKARALLERLGLGQRLDHRPNQLSGGQQQRVSIARALMNGGEIILADEPTGALDSHTGREMMEILIELNDLGHTVIIATHDMAIAANATRIIEIKDGVIVADRSGPRHAEASSSSPLTTHASDGASAAPSSRVASWQRVVEAGHMAIVALVAHRLRTSLTVLGVVIGIVSVVSMVTLGESARRVMEDELKGLAPNNLEIYPGKEPGDPDSAKIRTMSVADVDAIRQQYFVKEASPQLSQTTLLRRGAMSGSATVTGVGQNYFDIVNLPIELGIGFNPSDLQSQAQVVVIDANVRRKFFGQSNPLGETLYVGKLPCVIVGVTGRNLRQETRGSSTLNVWLPHSTAAARLAGRDNPDSIILRVRDTEISDVAQQKITSLLTLRHRLKDFFVVNIDAFIRENMVFVQSMSFLLAAIGVISLTVGGIGVMNIMLVSVTERTREIGVRIAVGARQEDIRTQFLIESIVVCLFGAAVGVILSYMVGLAANYVLPPEWELRLSFTAILAAVICAILTGVIFGYVPARNAARLDPVEALARD